MYNNPINIVASKTTLTWILDRPFIIEKALQDLGVKAFANGQEISTISININAVNFSQEGTYGAEVEAVYDEGDMHYVSRLPIIITIAKPTELQETLRDNNSNSARSNVAPVKTKKPVKLTKKKWYKYGAIGFGVIVIAMIIFSSLSQNKNNQQQLADQNSQISNLTQTQNKLKNQVQQLKDAQASYKQDKNNEALQNKLSNLQAQNNQLKNQINDNALKEKIDGINNQIDNLAKNPNNNQAIQNIENQLQNIKAKQTDILSQIKQYLSQIFK